MAFLAGPYIWIITVAKDERPRAVADKIRVIFLDSNNLSWTSQNDM